MGKGSKNEIYVPYLERHMHDLNLLRTFIVVAEERGISPAAKKLRVPKSTISRHVLKLEAEKNGPLFDRRQDGFDLTPMGRRLYERLHAAIHVIDGEFATDIEPAKSGKVSIYAPMIYGRGVLRPLIADYMRMNPEIAIEATFGDRFSEPPSDKVDLVFYVGISPGQEFDIWPVGFVEAKLYAAPSLFIDTNRPTSISELKHFPLLTTDCAPGEKGRISLLHKDSRTSALSGPVRLSTMEPDLLLDAVLSGFGIARLASFFADPFITSGRLETVLPDYTQDRHSVAIARARRNKNDTAIDFANYVNERLKSQSR